MRGCASGENGGDKGINIEFWSGIILENVPNEVREGIRIILIWMFRRDHVLIHINGIKPSGSGSIVFFSFSFTITITTTTTAVYFLSDNIVAFTLM
jgi:hypothetical protein